MGDVEGDDKARQTRRSVIAKAGVAGALAWTAPTIMSMNSPAAAASGGATPSWLDHIDSGCAPQPNGYCAPPDYSVMVWINVAVDTSFQLDYYDPNGFAFGFCYTFSAGLSPAGWIFCNTPGAAGYSVVVTRVDGPCGGALTSETATASNVGCGQQGGAVNAPQTTTQPRFVPTPS